MLDPNPDARLACILPRTDLDPARIGIEAHAAEAGTGGIVHADLPTLHPSREVSGMALMCYNARQM